MHPQVPASPRLNNMNCSPGPQSQRNMNINDYAAYVALDWGDTRHAFALQMAGSCEVETGHFDADAETVHDWLEQLGNRCAHRPVALAIEAGGDAVTAALLEHKWIVIYPVQSAMSARFRKALVPSGAKDDVPDASVLLTLLLRHGEQLRPLELDSAPTRELNALVVARRDAVNRRSQLTNQLRAVLKGYYPQALTLIGEDMAAMLALDFLDRWPDLASLRRARVSTVRSFYLLHSVRRPELLKTRLEHIAKARPLTEDPAVIDPAVLQVRMLVAVLRTLQTHIARFDSSIAQKFASHVESAFFRQLPGAGAQLAPRLLVAFGDRRNRYPDASSLQKHAGLAPVKEKSGRQLWVHWRWNAPIFLRQTFIEWAGQTVVYSGWAKAYYQQQKRAGKGHHAIIRALAFKWIRILWRCWQRREPYDELRYLNALKRRQSPLIASLAPSMSQG
jgi:transposase